MDHAENNAPTGHPIRSTMAQLIGGAGHVAAESSGVFRPELGVRILNTLAVVITMAVILALAFTASDVSSSWLVASSAAVVLAGGWIVYRCFALRIEFDQDTLTVIGFLWSRRIPRAALLSIDRDSLEMPMVQWSVRGAADRWTVLTPLILGSSPFVPATMHRRRHRFLVHLRSWAPDVDAPGIRPGLWSNAMNALADAALAVARSAATRIALAVVLIAASIACYWLGVTVAFGVMQGTQEITRTTFASIPFSAAMAEGAYWMLPLTSRKERSWHIALGVLMAPLAVLVLVATFS